MLLTPLVIPTSWIHRAIRSGTWLSCVASACAGGIPALKDAARA
jgi:hypothetical protein